MAGRVALKRQRLYRLLTLAGGIFLFGGYHAAIRGHAGIWTLGTDVRWGLFAVVVLSFLFAWWARLYLGPLWSSSVTRKQGHHVVDTGPYAIVRHPIYTGIIAAGIATAAQEGTWPALAGVALWIIGFRVKATLEEHFLREELGGETYDSYRRRVPMLLPFRPKSA